MPRPQPEINLFAYLDYRDYLRDWYQAQKKGRAISLRAFSQKAGFASPNYFKMVMDGDRNLTEASLVKFMTALNLNKQEQEFFRNLVLFNQAKAHEEKDRHYQALLQSRKFNQLKPIEKEQYEFFSDWYHPVVRELVVAPDFDGSLEKIAERIFPPITPQQVKKSVELLEKLGFITQENGRWRQATPTVTTGPESSSLQLLNYHLNILGVAKQILEKVPQEQRDISALTLGIAPERLSEIKQRIQVFRRELLQLVANDKPDKVVLFTMQLMPVAVMPITEEERHD